MHLQQLFDVCSQIGIIATGTIKEGAPFCPRVFLQGSAKKLLQSFVLRTGHNVLSKMPRTRLAAC